VMGRPTASLMAAARVGCGTSSIAEATSRARRMRVQTIYQPDFEDRLFNVLLPLAAYAILALSAVAAPPTHKRPCLRLELPRCYYSSSGSTTPGTASRTMYSSAGGIRIMSSTDAFNAAASVHAARAAGA
jgi:hypothetical protein